MDLLNEKHFSKIWQPKTNLNFFMRTSSPSAAESPSSDISFNISSIEGMVLMIVSKLSDLAVHRVSEKECNATFPFAMPLSRNFFSYTACLFGEPSMYL